MEKQDFLTKLKELSLQEDVLAVNQEVNELKSKFQDFLAEEERRIHTEMESHELNEAEEGQNKVEETTAETEASSDDIKEEFFKLYNEFRDRKTALVTSQKLEQEANLRIKQNLIARLRKLISEEENIGAAVAGYKEIHENWKIVGDIPREKRQEIQNEYSKLLESFFFNLKIYRELKEHDLKRNSQLKKELVEKIKALHSVQSIKEVEQAIKNHQNEFDEIGPVIQEEWEQIKTAYWDAVKSIYTKIHEFYEHKREEFQANIEKKKTLLETLTAYVSSMEEPTTAKEWDDKTQTLLKYQEEWKQIGFGNRKENEELWTAFRQQCDLFFSRKKEFYSILKNGQDQIATAKKEIIAKAHTYKESTDWKQTTDAILKLQQDWKKLGNAGQRMEQVLWKEFRSACDAFFNAKQKHFEESDKQNETNMAAKLDIISKIENYQAGEDKKQILADLREFSAAFNAVGKVPFKEKDRIYNEYKTAIDAQYGKLKLEGEEKEKAFFQAKMDSLKANPNAEKLVEKERRDMQQQISTLRHEINQFENNLGFFANSKGADALKKEVEQKITLAKRKIEDYQRKLKLLVHE